MSDELLKQIETKTSDLLKQVTETLAKRSEEKGQVSVSKMDENQLVHYNLSYSTAEKRISDHFT
ncbi:MAG TPA: acyl-CoA dehydrogenase, partial [Leptospiraceae bacterium]|nr:acyl-CoA dehydrogenase [Leptospiraceae bacterium]